MAVFYTAIKKAGINMTGCIVLARYGETFRGNIVNNAYDAGAIGVLIYSDRKDYGGGGGGTKWFPDDRWMPPSGVQVGTVYNGAGDPTTPGWPSSMEGCERLSEDEVERAGDVPLIPSLPISGADGEEILRWIGGEVAEDGWQGDVDAPVYRVGPGPAVIELSYKEIKANKGWAFLQKNQPWRTREINDRLMMAERALTDRDGLSGRPWYKHMIYAPSKHNRYGSKCFPGIDDAIENAKKLNAKDSWCWVQHDVWSLSSNHTSIISSAW